MKAQKFECQNCGASGSIKINESEIMSAADICMCPCCSAEIDIPDDDEEGDDYQEIL